MKYMDIESENAQSMILGKIYVFNGFLNIY